MFLLFKRSVTSPNSWSVKETVMSPGTVHAYVHNIIHIYKSLNIICIYIYIFTIIYIYVYTYTTHTCHHVYHLGCSKQAMVPSTPKVHPTLSGCCSNARRRKAFSISLWRCKENHENCMTATHVEGNWSSIMVKGVETFKRSVETKCTHAARIALFDFHILSSFVALSATPRVA